MTGGTAESQRKSTAGRLLTDRIFGPWFWGLVVSNVGHWLFNVTAVVVVFQITRSGVLVALVSVAQFAPLAVLSPLAGSMSDRMDRRSVLLVAQTVSAMAAGALAVAVVILGVDGLPGAWPILMAAMVMGAGHAVSLPALNALVPALVKEADLEGGVALTHLTFTVGRALGPAVSGGLLARVGPEVAFVANAVTSLALIAALLAVRPRSAAKPSSGDGSFRTGLRYIRDDRIAVMLLWGVAATGFAADALVTLAPPLANAVGGGSTLVAWMISAAGVAAIPAAALIGRLQPVVGSLRLAQTGAGTVMTGYLAAALAPVAELAVAGYALAGIGYILSLTGFTTSLQRRVPDAFLGRVMAIWGVAFLGTRPIAAMVHGGAADVTGPRSAMMIAVLAAASAGLTATRLRGRSTAPVACS